MELGLTPEQPDPVVAAVAAALGGPDAAPGPWWQAGLEEDLEET